MRLVPPDAIGRQVQAGRGLLLLQRGDALGDNAKVLPHLNNGDRDRLFTFLENDGVPWNNNNAEHAIKAFVRLRNIIGGTSTVKGLREYLVLVSINETCKCKGVSFLDFLMSEEADVDTFVSKR
jgi:hypothetical protein